MPSPLVLRFMEVTGADAETAESFMRRTRNDVAAAVAAYNSDVTIQRKKAEVARCSVALGKIFDQYASLGDDPAALFEDGLFKFFADVGVPSSTRDSIMPLAVAWKLQCATPGEISRNEFTKGFAAAGCDSVPRIRAYLAAVSRHLDRGEDFRSLYQWLFGFAKENSQRKVLLLSEAVAFWTEVLPLLPRLWQAYPQWLAFLEEHKEQYATISADLWMNVFDFAQIVGDKLSNHNDADAWHTGIDHFVSWLKASQAKAAQADAPAEAGGEQGQSASMTDTDASSAVASLDGPSAAAAAAATAPTGAGAGAGNASSLPDSSVAGHALAQQAAAVGIPPAAAAAWARVPVVVVPPSKVVLAEFDT